MIDRLDGELHQHAKAGPRVKILRTLPGVGEFTALVMPAEIGDFGLSDATLTANSVLIPVAHYVHYRNLTEQYRTAPGAKQDCTAVRGWVMRSLVKQGVWGSRLDTLSNYKFRGDLQ